MNGKPYILVVDDEPDLLTLVTYNLTNENFEVEETTDGEEAMTMIDERLPDLLLLDWMLPRLSGIEICRRLRQSPSTKTLPIIMLTARSEEHDRIRGLNCGADDYISKPFSPNELVARVKAVLRRLRPSYEAAILAYHDITMDLTNHRVNRGKNVVDLGPLEYKLLRHFLENPRRVYSREQLLDVVWGQNIYVEDRTVDVHIRRLRSKLNKWGGSDIIRTIRSAGYSLDLQK